MVTAPNPSSFTNLRDHHAAKVSTASTVFFYNSIARGGGFEPWVSLLETLVGAN